MIDFPKIIEAYPATTREAVENFESKLGFYLPEIYKQFLIEKNGGRPEEKQFQIFGLDNNPYGAIQVFFGIGAPFAMSDVVRHNELYRNGFPGGIVAIASTGGPSPVILDLRSGKERVLYFDFTHYWGTGEWRECDLYFIAESFEKFLSNLR
jgi:SMI1 / KNR4 family (SUKH-1)